VHARETTLRARESQFDGLMGVIRGRVLPAARRQPGYVGVSLYSDRRERRVVGTTWWRTEADMLANERSGYLAEQLEALSPLLSEPPSIERYDVDPER
jgi:heme-degrading monooxygenase HmoA